ncbi:uncharacterized protein LOC103396645 isoform X2 [Cynoglossus semilaevis]|uniref:Uncharacterized LOC103396645 n=1 Tax=Cynoglossus semilaevis TaxID=244447 RepID=A0A3P8X2Q0_CYNSE|nr:uncharacterized protein LOC103396645 isoform X2 [Cynoglossus semilaevis]
MLMERREQEMQEERRSSLMVGGKEGERRRRLDRSEQLAKARAEMEEPAVQQEKIDGSLEGGGGRDGGKADWKSDCSLSSLLKHSCFLCWSSPWDKDTVGETDEGVLAKVAEIRELENAVAMENLELQEQQSDRKELEETLVKLESHKEKLIQEIKETRQLCYEESQQILSLQTEEVKKESQVEEYERELARARWRLRRLREEVKVAKRKVEEAGERNTPLQDSIRQSYEEILQEENTLCSMSESAVTPESQLEVSTSPADTTEDDPLPLKPWGRSQSLPAYADLIMRASNSSFCQNLADTREEIIDSRSSSSKMERSDTEDDPEENEINNEVQKLEEHSPKPLSQLDFYQANPFANCQTDHDLFNDDIFLKSDASDGFASDPFKGSDPFVADILYQEPNVSAVEGAGNAGDEVDTSLSCAENKASTGTQCFESEFPDEDSDIEISYSREDLDTIGNSHGFKPIQSSSDELGPDPQQGWRSQGQYSVESDPNGYELDLHAPTPPSDIEEQSLGSLADETTLQPPGELKQDPSFDQIPMSPKQSPVSGSSSPEVERFDNNEEESKTPTAPEPSPEFSQNAEPDLQENKEISFDLNYEATCQSSFDPYGFKLSPEHSNHTLLDPDEASSSPEPPEHDLAFDSEPHSPQPNEMNFDSYGLDITSPHADQDSDPYGFKLCPDEQNQEVLDLCGFDYQPTMEQCTYDSDEQVEPYEYSNQEVLEPDMAKNQELPEHCSQKDLYENGNQEVLDSSIVENEAVVRNDNNELLDLFIHGNQELLEPGHNTCDDELLENYNYGNQEVVEPCSPSNKELLECSQVEDQDASQVGNQELLDLDSKGDEEAPSSESPANDETLLISVKIPEVLDFDSYSNMGVESLLCKEGSPEANNNNKSFVEPELSSTDNSSDSDVATKDLGGLDFSNTSVCIPKTRNTTTGDISTVPFNQVLNTYCPPTMNVLEGDLSSVFGAGGYIGCPDVADDLEPLDKRQFKPVAEPVRPTRPVRPPRPSLKVKEKASFQTHGIDLK